LAILSAVRWTLKALTRQGSELNKAQKVPWSVQVKNKSSHFHFEDTILVLERVCFHVFFVDGMFF